MRVFVLTLAASLALASCGDSSGPPPFTGDPDAADVQLVVDVAMNRRAISPLVYGINQDVDYASDRSAIVRSGGNRLTAYNWENNASNAGSDYCHQNDATFGGPGSSPAAAFRELLDQARSRGTAAIVTIPIVDDVAADHDDLGDVGQGPPACVGDVANSGGNYLIDRFAKNHPRKGSAFSSSPDPNDDAVYQDELVAYLESNWGDVPIYVSLDNEPELWSSTHARIHPAAVTYAELVARSIAFADAAKDAWPEVPVLGFVSYGYAGYTNLQSASDAGAHGPFIPYYLEQMEAAEASTGHRLLDLLDVHWYPEARGGGIRITETSGATAAEERMQAPRSLWDPAYEEDSWIVNDVLHQPIRLVPWLREQIDASYPGTGLAITEWNYGGGDHISGAIATADALGVFGREGVDLATLWLLHGDEPFTRAGLRAFTNYDGAGHGFESTSVSATSSDAARVTVYASHGAGDRVVLVVLNKHDAPLDAGLSVAGAGSFDRASRWVLSGSNPSFVASSELGATLDHRFVVPLPARSVTVVVPE